MNRLRSLLACVAAGAWLLAVAAGPVAAAAPPPSGPPFPAPEIDRAVYDYAGLFSPATIVEAETTIDAIEARTGAEIVVYTQDAGGYPTTEETEAKARALIDQWGIGRAGFNDGLVIFFDIDPTCEHGQVQLYAAPGFEAAYLTNSERQAIFDNDMLPHLREADFDGALDGRPREGRCGGHRRARGDARAGSPGQRRPRAWSARRSCSWACPAGRSTTGGGSARTRSTSTTRRSSCRLRRPT